MDALWSRYTATGYNASNASDAIGKNKNEKPIYALSVLSGTWAGWDDDAHFSYSKGKIPQWELKKCHLGCINSAAKNCKYHGAFYRALFLSASSQATY